MRLNFRRYADRTIGDHLSEARIEDVWEDFVVAAEDAVRASYRESHDTLTRLVAALDAQPLEALVGETLPEADFDAWLEASVSSIGSMAGSGRMSWPTKTEERVALQLALLRELAAGKKITVQGLLLNFYTSKLEEGYSRFLRAVLQPCLRDFSRILQSKVEPRRTSTETAMPNANPKTVFVVHGRNSAARDAMFQFLRAIGLHPLEWTEAVALTGTASPYVGAILEKAFSVAQALIVLMTGDDEAQLRAALHGPAEERHEVNPTPQARANVLFEAGLAFGSHPDRTVLVELGKLRPFSDIGGRHTVRITNQTERRQDLAMRLRNAGCAVNLDGTDWHRAGDFDASELGPPPSSLAQNVARVPNDANANLMDRGIDNLDTKPSAFRVDHPPPKQRDRPNLSGHWRFSVMITQGITSEGEMRPKEVPYSLAVELEESAGKIVGRYVGADNGMCGKAALIGEINGALLQWDVEYEDCGGIKKRFTGTVGRDQFGPVIRGNTVPTVTPQQGRWAGYEALEGRPL